MSSSPVNFAATIVITTKNRKEELRNAVTSALMQIGSPEVLVIDDGSTDGTSEMVRGEFPQVSLYRSEQSLGLVVQRNNGARLAKGNIIISIDDDAVLSTPNVVVKTLADFDHPRIGAVAIPFINVRQDKTEHQRAADDSDIYVVDDFIGTAHAVRREVFLNLEGYRELLVHQGEERDFCIRMLQAGYVVRLGRADPIHHFESPRRDFRRMDLYGRRNDVLFAWYNVPMPDLVGKLLATTAGGLIFGIRVKRPLRMLHGLALGWGGIGRYWNQRQPVTNATYALFKILRTSRSVAIKEIESRLADQLY